VKVSDAVAEFISKIGTSEVFGVSGGASLHLLDSVRRHPSLRLICVHHEQTVAMAADAYSRLTNRVGVGIVTSGPGATNLITGIAGAFFDSVPCIFITGQVSTTRMKGELGVRQIGFQETPIVEIARPITKLAITINNPHEVLTTLHRAWNIAVSGRPGPVLIDIPDNIQRMELVVTEQTFEIDNTNTIDDLNTSETSDHFLKLLRSSKKPIIVCGSGIRISKNFDSVVQKIAESNIPVALTWGAKDLFSSENEMVLGTFGTHGVRIVNTALNTCDLMISIGSRLDLKATGSPLTSFAPNAKKIMFDIDLNEIMKFKQLGMKIDLPICLAISSKYFDFLMDILSKFEFQIDDWKFELQTLKNSTAEEPRNFKGFGVNPYKFIDRLSELVSSESNIVVDTGCAVAWTMQGWLVKTGQRIIHDFNNTAMGWSIPATLASVLSQKERKTICIVGDGSIMMALSDLSTISSSGSSTIIFLMNNSGYSMIRQTQDQWFEGNYFASSESDLHFTDFAFLAKANNFDYYRIENEIEISSTLVEALKADSNVFCEVIIQPDARVVPIVKFGNPNHQMEPEL
jgi:acetolactate synthase I/II/III large subunit